MVFVSLITLTFFVFAKCNHKSHPVINAFVKENTNEWDSIKQQPIDTTNCTQMKLRFLNNPYRFNNSNNVAIYIDQVLVFKGSFASIFNLYIPNNFLQTVCFLLLQSMMIRRLITLYIRHQCI